ncbi:MAG: CaiB/BaiF CoA-transferase family protein [Sulfuricaulis sp.]|uniref:CaiB/BaiF CoA transferase family protein n=1 Tax=Sulfuricaulis sp. TaxID=2003553 RepID=UPI0034A48156
MNDKPLPLKGLKVIELGTLIAGPFAGKLFAEFGAEVIKIETPGDGDPLRSWRKLHQGTSLWWYLQARNKKSVTVDLKAKEGQEIVRRLVRNTDIVIENFRPGTMEKWNLGWDALSGLNPGLVMVRVSGYGQSGPYRDRTGFGAIGESMGGLRYVTGDPGRPPVRVGISLGDALAAMYGVIGALTAVYHRKVNGGKGQYVDVALYEAVFSMMESMLPEYAMTGFIRERSGGALPGIAPSNTYLCRDGKYVVIGANNDSIFKRLMITMERRDLADDPGLANNTGRAQRAEALDQAIGAWTARYDLDSVLEKLEAAQVPSGKIYNIQDIVEDVHYRARDMIQEFALKGGEKIALPGIVPKLSETPGDTRWLGPELGAHTVEVLTQIGYDAAQQAELKQRGVI